MLSVYNQTTVIVLKSSLIRRKCGITIYLFIYLFIHSFIHSLLYIIITAPLAILTQSLIHPSISLRKGWDHLDLQPILAHQVTTVLGTSFPIEAIKDGIIRRTGSTNRQPSQDSSCYSCWGLK